MYEKTIRYLEEKAQRSEQMRKPMKSHRDHARGGSNRVRVTGYNRSNTDGRNPYGSKGGYVVSSRGRGRGRDYNMGEDYARNGRMMSGNRDRAMQGNDYAYNRDYAEYNRGQSNRDYAEYDMGRNSMGYEQSRQYDRDYGYEEDGHYGRTYYPIEAMGTFNGYYGMGEEDYADYNYMDGNTKLSSKDIKKWEKELENADGTKGKKWDADQIRQVAQQHGIRFEEYSPELLTAVANSLYSDYCKVLGADMVLYVKLAKAFLEDDDFEGTPEEKAMLYYKCIVSKDD